MSDMIKEKLCATCRGREKECREIEIEERGTCKVYKCLNYELDDSKILPRNKFNYFIKSDIEK